MKKILLAFDGPHFSEGAFEFARRINERSPILLTGIFLPQTSYANLWSYAHGASGAGFIPMLEEDETEAVHKNIERFKNDCVKHGIEYRVHKDFFDFALPELKKETRFADLLVVGSESFYENVGTREPNDYLKEALHASECAVVVVPEHFEFPDSNILAYDGSEQSVYALKQFAYLFPEWAARKTLLVYVKQEEGISFPYEQNIAEWTARHFPDLTLMKLEIDPKNYFAIWVSEKKGAMLVSGAFSRSVFSQLFKKSFVSEVIHDHRLPVFITHR